MGQEQGIRSFWRLAVLSIAVIIVVLALSKYSSAGAMDDFLLIANYIYNEIRKALAEWSAKLALITMSPLILFVQINPCVYSSGAPDANGISYCDPYNIGLPSGGISFSMPVDPAIRQINTSLMGMIQLFYVLAIIFTGGYLILMSGSPHGRAMAKDTFVRLVIGMVLVSLSPVIFQFMIDIVRGVTTDLIAISTPSSIGGITTYFTDAKFCCTMWIFLAVMVIAGLIAAFRYFLVYLLAAFFPLIVFMYFTDIPNPLFSLRGLGTRAWRFLVLVFMIQIMQALFLVIGFLMAATPARTPLAFMLDFILMIASFAGIIMTPLIGMQLMEWVGAVVYISAVRPSSPMSRFMAQWMRSGSISSALSTSSGAYMVGHNMSEHTRGAFAAPGAPDMASTRTNTTPSPFSTVPAGGMSLTGQPTTGSSVSGVKGGQVGGKGGGGGIGGGSITEDGGDGGDGGGLKRPAGAPLATIGGRGGDKGTSLGGDSPGTGAGAGINLGTNQRQTTMPLGGGNDPTTKSSMIVRDSPTTITDVNDDSPPGGSSSGKSGNAADTFRYTRTGREGVETKDSGQVTADHGGSPGKPQAGNNQVGVQKPHPTRGSSSLHPGAGSGQDDVTHLPGEKNRPPGGGKGSGKSSQKSGRDLSSPLTEPRNTRNPGENVTQPSTSPNAPDSGSSSGRRRSPSASDTSSSPGYSGGKQSSTARSASGPSAQSAPSPEVSPEAREAEIRMAREKAAEAARLNRELRAWEQQYHARLARGEKPEDMPAYIRNTYALNKELQQLVTSKTMSPAGALRSKDSILGLAQGYGGLENLMNNDPSKILKSAGSEPTADMTPEQTAQNQQKAEAFVQNSVSRTQKALESQGGPRTQSGKPVDKYASTDMASSAPALAERSETDLSKVVASKRQEAAVVAESAAQMRTMNIRKASATRQMSDLVRREFAAKGLGTKDFADNDEKGKPGSGFEAAIKMRTEELMSGRSSIDDFNRGVQAHGATVQQLERNVSELRSLGERQLIAMTSPKELNELKAKGQYTPMVRNETLKLTDRKLITDMSPEDLGDAVKRARKTVAGMESDRAKRDRAVDDFAEKKKAEAERETAKKERADAKEAAERARDEAKAEAAEKDGQRRLKQIQDHAQELSTMRTGLQSMQEAEQILFGNKPTTPADEIPTLSEKELRRRHRVLADRRELIHDLFGVRGDTAVSLDPQGHKMITVKGEGGKPDQSFDVTTFANSLQNRNDTDTLAEIARTQVEARKIITDKADAEQRKKDKEEAALRKQEAARRSHEEELRRQARRQVILSQPREATPLSDIEISTHVDAKLTQRVGDGGLQAKSPQEMASLADRARKSADELAQATEARNRALDEGKAHMAAANLKRESLEREMLILGERHLLAMKSPEEIASLKKSGQYTTMARNESLKLNGSQRMDKMSDSELTGQINSCRKTVEAAENDRRKRDEAVAEGAAKVKAKADERTALEAQMKALARRSLVAKTSESDVKTFETDYRAQYESDLKQQMSEIASGGDPSTIKTNEELAFTVDAARQKVSRAEKERKKKDDEDQRIKQKRDDAIAEGQRKMEEIKKRQEQAAKTQPAPAAGSENPDAQPPKTPSPTAAKPVQPNYAGVSAAIGAQIALETGKEPTRGEIYERLKTLIVDHDIRNAPMGFDFDAARKSVLDRADERVVSSLSQEELDAIAKRQASETQLYKLSSQKLEAQGIDAGRIADDLNRGKDPSERPITRRDVILAEHTGREGRGIGYMTDYELSNHIDQEAESLGLNGGKGEVAQRGVKEASIRNARNAIAWELTSQGRDVTSEDIDKALAKHAKEMGISDPGEMNPSQAQELDSKMRRHASQVGEILGKEVPLEILRPEAAAALSQITAAASGGSPASADASARPRAASENESSQEGTVESKKPQTTGSTSHPSGTSDSAPGYNPGSGPIDLVHGEEGVTKHESEHQSAKKTKTSPKPQSEDLSDEPVIVETDSAPARTEAASPEPSNDTVDSKPERVSIPISDDARAKAPSSGTSDRLSELENQGRQMQQQINELKARIRRGGDVSALKSELSVAEDGFEVLKSELEYWKTSRDRKKAA